MALLEVRDLRTSFKTDDGIVQAVDGVSFTVDRSQTLGIVGESGCGKSVTSLTIMGLNNPRNATSSGEAVFDGEDLLTASQDRLRQLRGQKIAMIFQDPMTSLNPVKSLGWQLSEAVLLHNDVSKKEARDRAVTALGEVGIPKPGKRVDDYPHQFSGGMRQRVMIAMALINDPDLLIADEPTTALDVTTQAQILELMRQLQAEHGTAIIMITHDLGVVAEVADDVVVMYAGRAIEEAPVDRDLHGATPSVHLGAVGVAAAHGRRYRSSRAGPGPAAVAAESAGRLPLQPALYVHDGSLSRRDAGVACVARVARPPGRLLSRRGHQVARARAPARGHGNGDGMSDDLLVVEHLQKFFPVTQGIIFQKQVAAVQAVDDVSFTIGRGETLGVVGESGCGKSTMARCIARLLDPTGGKIIFDGVDITNLSRAEMRPVRREMMMVFQDPYASLNARKRVGFIVGEPLEVHGIGTDAERKRRVQELLEIVGLNPEHYNRFPHEFSGGQRQRIGVARALAANPKLIICDEPVSALDVSVQAQILNLLKDLQREFGLTYLFIAHDLNVVRHISDRVLVMYLGKVAEVGKGRALYDEPKHPYTGALLSAVPIPNPQLGRSRKAIVLEGDVPSPMNPPAGCRFHPRCPRHREGTCDVEEPALRGFGDGHEAACHFPLERWPMTVEDVRRPSDAVVAS